MGMIQYVKVTRKNLQDPTEPEKTYATSQSRGRIGINALAKHMSLHGSPFSRGTIKAVLEDVVDHVTELICDGNIVDLGILGTFNVKLISNGVAESVADPKTKIKPVFSAADIDAVELRFTPGEAFKEMLSECEFTEVPPLKKQAEAMKIEAEKRKESGSDGDGDVVVHE
ncbi:MAG: HU family DNA-binding protein [Bacteroidales bacterium]|nr:HU family DNA-binding protein [Bacteroidales bacterium]